MIKNAIAVFTICGALIACNNADVKVKVETDDQTEAVVEKEVEEVVLSKEERIVPVEGAMVIFENLEDGAEVMSPVKVIMGVTGMTIEPAGDKITPGTGHHHILIDNDLGYIPSGEIVPMDDKNIHFGKGQTETMLELEPGTYTLSLQFANAFHESYGEQMSKTISVTVK
jgi:hypothetical protein